MPVEMPSTQRRTFCIGRSAMSDASSFNGPMEGRSRRAAAPMPVGGTRARKCFPTWGFLFRASRNESWIVFSEDDHTRRRREHPAAAVHNTARPKNFRDWRIDRCLSDQLKVSLRLISNSLSAPCSRRSLPGLSPRSEDNPGRCSGRSLHKIVLLDQFEYSSKNEPDYFDYERGYAL